MGDQQSHLLEMLHELARAKVEFIVCGGVAAVLHGVERMTLDLDLSVKMDKKNIEHLDRVVKKLGLVPRVPVPLLSISDPEKVAIMIKEKNAVVFSLIDNEKPFRHIDIMLTREHLYENLLPSSECITIRGDTIRVISKSKLIEIKEKIKPPRDKDKIDIDTLKKLL
ncbi:MAG: hypothetical protein GF401_18575 [Chitinivibrionales bacterium]|nr:hypothetical protein [Chitinivibrionales bacterium]